MDREADERRTGYPREHPTTTDIPRTADGESLRSTPQSFLDPVKTHGGAGGRGAVTTGEGSVGSYT